MEKMEKWYVKIENTFCNWKTQFSGNRCTNKEHPKRIGWIFPKCEFKHCPIKIKDEEILSKK